jgi:hypothetical protein
LHFQDEIASRSKIPGLNDKLEALLLKDVGDPFRPGAVGDV